MSMWIYVDLTFVARDPHVKEIRIFKQVVFSGPAHVPTFLCATPPEGRATPTAIQYLCHPESGKEGEVMGSTGMEDAKELQSPLKECKVKSDMQCYKGSEGHITK